ncbi:hypothetical protein DEJ34_05930 [Curtobacterium sp. MCPF17_050]|uniref:hypothetical protein n=1 Tax=Curtobacterium sp. MCPF17_050 TaxID=2175664 RepID=UPI0011B58DC6|nr:hypothetical protein [Curtobacterium sp. MCPF17_050]WIB16665.1 hypothetical protein DEJ34_05930 [Curtobacterium sp. MCPF17_050]
MTSPQLPGLIAGAATMQELSDDLFAIAVEAGMDPHGSLFEYEQHVIEVEDRVFAVRVKGDYSAGERVEIATDVLAHIASDGGLRSYTTEDDLGDTVIVVALPTDRIVDVTASLDDSQPATIAVQLPQEDSISYTGIVRGAPRENHVLRLSDVGLDGGSTVADLFARLSERIGSTTASIERELVSA